MWTPQRLHRLVSRSINLRFYATSSAARVIDLVVPDPSPEYSYLPGFPRPNPAYKEILQAIPREDSGTRKSVKERKAGRIPGILFSRDDGENGGNKRLISLQASQIKKLVNHFGRPYFMSRLFELEVRSDSELVEKVRVLPRLVHLHPVTDVVLNVTLLRAPSTAWFKVDVPLNFVGEDVSPGLKKGAYLKIMKRTVKYFCPAAIIPPYIEVDISELDVNQRIKGHQLNAHPALKFLGREEDPVVIIAGKPERQQGKPSSE